MNSLSGRAADYVSTHFHELWRFGAVGVVTFGINFASFAFWFSLLHLDYRLAASFAYVITVLCHFLLNKHFTFGAHDQSITRNLPRYAAMLLLNYLITITASWLTVEELHLSPYFGVIASTIGTALSSFVVMKHFVFRPQAA